MDPDRLGRSGAVVALKPLEQAKSRLGTVAPLLRRQLAWAMALDTLAALSAVFEDVLVVSAQTSLQARLYAAGLPVPVVSEPGPVGMNGALDYGSEMLRSRGCRIVCACVADLPALRPDSVRRVILAQSSGSRSFLADATGVGTTMLVAADVALDPRFQGASAAAHRASGAVPLLEAAVGQVPDARQDVDTEADLQAAAPLGLGTWTAALLHLERYRLADPRAL